MKATNTECEIVYGLSAVWEGGVYQYPLNQERVTLKEMFQLHMFTCYL